MHKIFILLISMFSFCCNSQIEKKKVYLLPDKYQGVVVVVFNQKEGEIPVHENGADVYGINSSGVLKLKEKASTGWIKESFFYIGADGSRKEIPYYTATDVRDKGSDKSKIICYNSERGLVADEVTKEEKRFQVMLISSIENLDSIAKKRSSVVREALR